MCPALSQRKNPLSRIALPLYPAKVRWNAHCILLFKPSPSSWGCRAYGRNSCCVSQRHLGPVSECSWSLGMTWLTHGNSQERDHNLDTGYPHERRVNTSFYDPIIGTECQAEWKEVLRQSARGSKFDLRTYLKYENASEGFYGNVPCT